MKLRQVGPSRWHCTFEVDGERQTIAFDAKSESNARAFALACIRKERTK
jgi:hypothetical protein